MRIIACDLTTETSSDVFVRWIGSATNIVTPFSAVGDANRRVYAVLAANNDESLPKGSVATTNGNPTGTNEWIDVSATTLYASRFYDVSALYGGVRYTNAEEWAFHVQDRPLNSRFLICVPVNLLTNGNNLNSAAGLQLARGLHAAGATNGADILQYWTTNKLWKEAYLLTNATGVAYWYDGDTGNTSDVPVTAGMAIWVVKGSVGAARSNTVFAGRSYVAGTVVPLQFTTNNNTAWNMFGWTLAQARWNRSSITNDQLGFYGLGTGGSSADWSKKSEWGDQIWTWKNNTFKYYWLIDHVGAPWDGRWYDYNANTFANFALEPGMGYFYYHPTNWAGTNFTWTPSLP